MKYIYGLSISGKSILDFFYMNKIAFIAWDDSSEIRDEVRSIYNKVKFTSPDKLDWKLIKEAYISPGINLNKKFLFKKKNKSKLFRDLEIYSQFVKDQKIIAVTGTNGKSTTVTLIDQMMKKNNIKSFVGGNLGVPLMNFLNKDINHNYHIIELSSYQLESAPSFSPYISILLNVSDDHLDRYRSIEDYAKTKEKIISKDNKSYFVVSVDDPFSKKIYKKNINDVNKIIPISINKKISNGISYIEDTIYDNFFEKKIFKIKDLSISLIGSLNKQNILATYAVSKILGIKKNVFIDTLKYYIGLPHRLEILYKSKKYLIINNSKATNFESTIKTIENYKNIFLIIGGRIKNKDFSIFKNVKKNINKCFIIGESTNFIFNQLSLLFECEKSYKLENAINSIFLDLRNNKIKANIILAPACSSFDQFSNFEHRGNVFKKLIKNKIKLL